jgi:hypothetical protein
MILFFYVNEGPKPQDTSLFCQRLPVSQPLQNLSYYDPKSFSFHSPWSYDGRESLATYKGAVQLIN